MTFLFLTSGLFLGWSLGANHAANVFGTAVGSKMVKFRTAALIAGIFVIMGAVVSGAGASNTLGRLGSVNAMGGAFMVTFATGFTVYLMTYLKLPVSTSQAIVGAIVGWNLYSGFPTGYNSFSKIVATWVVCPVLAGVFSAVLYWIMKKSIGRKGMHLLRFDAYLRLGLIIVGSFGSFSLGANNIANVMGVFVPTFRSADLNILGLVTLNSVQQLFLIGGIAIAVGIFTYSEKVIKTIGNDIQKLSPETALIVVLAESLVLFLFSSQGLEAWLKGHGLPSIPLVPISSTQAVVGAIIGIGVVKGVRGMQFRVLGKIATGWVTAPLIAGLVTFVCLFFLQNVFRIEVYKPAAVTACREAPSGPSVAVDPNPVSLRGN